METTSRSTLEFVIRFLVVTLASIAFGFTIFGREVFVATMWPFQFTMSGVTAGLAYASLKDLPSARSRIAALFVWFIIMQTLVVRFNTWLPILYGAYIGGIAGAIYLYSYVIREGLIRGVVQRVAAALVFICVVNVLIIVVLSTVQILLSSYPHLHTASYQSAIFGGLRINMSVGGMIGLAVGIGIELAEYLLPWLMPAIASGGVVTECASCGAELELEDSEIGLGEYTCPECGNKSRI